MGKDSGNLVLGASRELKDCVNVASVYLTTAQAHEVLCVILIPAIKSSK